MRHIEHILGIISHGWLYLETPRPTCIADALCDRLWRDLNGSLVVQFFRCRDRQRQVAQLMTPDQRGVHNNFLSEHRERIPLSRTARSGFLGTGY